MRAVPVLAALCALSGALPCAAPAMAAPILGPGDAPELDAQMARHARQFYQINAYPFGLSLDGHYDDEGARQLIEQFLAQDQSDDFAAVTGSHVYEVLSGYGEHGDLGFFGGVALAGTALRYMTLKRDGAAAAEVAIARQRVVQAADSWHVFYVVTGGGGLVARGIEPLLPPDPNDPPLPGSPPETTPLFDDDGQPLPMPKDNGSDRDDNSGGALPEGHWQWKDSCSKDQMVGQVLGLVMLYDAMKDDPDIDQALVERLAEDAREVGRMLMEPRDIGELEGAAGTGVYDLIIMDADGRPTFHHDLNPLSLEKIYFLDSPGAAFNRFNLLMSLGVIKGLYHVSGDPDLERYLYEELLGRRDYLGKVLQEDHAVDYIYMGINTNFDNPDMTSIALWLSIYLESDPAVSAVMRSYLETGWWTREGQQFVASRSKQPLWHAIYLTLTDRGVDPGLVDELVDLLLGFQLGPYFNDARVNCDEAEIAAGECLAVDGETIITLAGSAGEGDLMATEALHPSIRPPSNFDARSNPFQVNGGGGSRLNPGGDLLAAYWMARFFQASEPGSGNLSPNAREHMPVGGLPPEQAQPAVQPVGGCGCSLVGASQQPRAVWWLLLGLLLLARRPRRSRGGILA